MKDAIYRIDDCGVQSKEWIDRYVIHVDGEEFAIVVASGGEMNATAKDPAMDQALKNLLAEHHKRPVYRRTVLAKAFAILYDAFDAHTARHHYMEIANWIIENGGEEILPAELFAYMVGLRAARNAPSPEEA